MKKKLFVFFSFGCVFFYFAIGAVGEPLVSQKKEAGRAGRSATPQMMFFDAAEEDAQDRYAVIVSPEDEQQEKKEQSAEKGEAADEEAVSPEK